ncbi:MULTISPECIES: BhlA/UviB family holin-like peptide [Vallitalea]|uniref:BhlA/UviB family holin-like peptide n=1 Tax=Vallitalea maricola TaxID=3074433 RepID=A0ACB5URQ4_9FIRM|nr:BhlA/UviB family holin-like peptide [Vallitalea guaymasensis]GMQ65333.1 BhlA/UviB family holin-like peptide [Vallitalea sp. AN17-2]
MESEILKVAITQGLWATLSVILIFYILKSQEKRDIKQENREKKYQEIVSKLTEQLYIVKDIQDDIKELRNSR